eukprot:scaffold187388_cov47-Attheya_sp.AAC.1
MGDSCICFFGGLGRCDGAKCDQHGVVDRSAIIEKHADYFLNTSDAGSREERSGIFRIGELLCGPIVGWNVFGRGFLRFWRRRVLETVECVFYIPRQGHVDISVFVVPLEGETTIVGAIPISRHGVLLTETG